LGAPPEMPDRRSQFPGRRLFDFVKQYPGFLRPDAVEQSGELRLLAIELRGVEINRAFRIESVQVQMMKMGFGILRLGGPGLGRSVFRSRRLCLLRVEAGRAQRQPPRKEKRADEQRRQPKIFLEHEESPR